MSGANNIKDEFDASEFAADVDPAIEQTQLSIAGLVTLPYDTVEVNYTDDTKEVISTVDYKKDGVVVTTITVTQPTTTKEVYTNL
jgi:hypothetical protein